MLTPLRFVKRQALARPLACFAAAFLIGLVIEKRHTLPTTVCFIALAASAGLLYALRKHRRARAAFILLLGIAAGMARMGVALDAIPAVETRYSVEMTGRVVSEPFTNTDSGRCICKFAIDTVNGEPSSLHVRLYLRGDDAAALEGVEYGQRLRLTGHIWAADPVTNPHEFDFGDYLNRQGLDAYATAKIENVEITAAERDLYSIVIDARRAVSRRIDILFPTSAGMKRALVLGDRSLLGDELRDALSRSGTAHLISISGLHVTLLAAMIALLLGSVMPRRRARLIAILLLIPYGALIGFTAPFTRALVMFALFCLAPSAGRLSDGVTLLGAAMLVWLGIRPLDIGDAGFALSFSASAGILLLMPTLTRLTGIDAVRQRKPSPDPLRRAARRAALYLPQLLCASVAAQLMTLPYVIASFGVQSVVSLPFNLICVPLCMAGYVLGVLALMLSVVSLPLAALLARLPDTLFTWLAAITAYGARIPAATVRVGRYPFALLLMHWAVALTVSDLSRISLHRRGWMFAAFVGVACLSTLLTFLGAWRFSVTFLDAEQADCAVVRARGHTVLVDAGDTYTPAADYLNATCLNLDAVVLSHPHQDHAGGLNDVLDSFTPGVVYVPKGWFDVAEVAPAVSEGVERAREMGVPIRELAAGDVVSLSNDMTLTVFSPTGGAPPESVNDMSMLALISFDGESILFTGDLSAEAEPEVIPDADVLKVAHHGSSKATSARFLEACSPEIAVVSVGENNYNHPSPDTVARLAQCGADVYLTRSSGAVTATWTGEGWRIDTYLEASDAVERILSGD